MSFAFCSNIHKYLQLLFFCHILRNSKHYCIVEKFGSRGWQIWRIVRDSQNIKPSKLVLITNNLLANPAIHHAKYLIRVNLPTLFPANFPTIWYLISFGLIIATKLLLLAIILRNDEGF